MASLEHVKKIVVKQQGAVGLCIVLLRTGAFTLHLCCDQELVTDSNAKVRIW